MVCDVCYVVCDVCDVCYVVCDVCDVWCVVCVMRLWGAVVSCW